MELPTGFSENSSDVSSMRLLMRGLLGEDFLVIHCLKLDLAGVVSLMYSQ